MTNQYQINKYKVKKGSSQELNRPPRQQSYKPQPPKKPMCAFFLYRMDIYPVVKDRFPGYRITEITRQIGEMWKSLDQKTKDLYDVKAAKEKERVGRQRQHYESLYGKPETKRKRKRKMKRDYEILKRYINASQDIQFKNGKDKFFE